MPPKATVSRTESVTLSGKNVTVLRKLLCSLDTKVNYATIGRALGLNTPSNGRMAVRNAVSPLGVTIKDGNFQELIDDDDTVAADGCAPATKNGTTTPKRKRGFEVPDGDGQAKKTKKNTAAAVIVKAEEGAEADEGCNGSN